jgi:hypothetical protein
MWQHARALVRRARAQRQIWPTPRARRRHTRPQRRESARQAAAIEE